MHLFLEEGTRSGVCYVSKIHSKTNNKHLKSYDPKKESKHVIYLDANNLYGFATSKFLPAGGFKWIDPKEFDMNKYNSNSSKGCAIEVDLEYPKELCELHNNDPFAADKIEIKKETFSKYQLVISNFYNNPFGYGKKLVPK